MNRRGKPVGCSVYTHHRLVQRATRALLLSAVALQLGACGALTGEKQIGGNRYLLEEPYGAGTSHAEAVADLERRAEGLCGQGFRKINDYDRTAQQRRILVWDIVCRGEFKEYDGFTIQGRPN